MPFNLNLDDEADTGGYTFQTQVVYEPTGVIGQPCAQMPTPEVTTVMTHPEIRQALIGVIQLIARKVDIIVPRMGIRVIPAGELIHHQVLDAVPLPPSLEEVELENTLIGLGIGQKAEDGRVVELACEYFSETDGKFGRIEIPRYAQEDIWTIEFVYDSDAPPRPRERIFVETLITQLFTTSICQEQTVIFQEQGGKLIRGCMLLGLNEAGLANPQVTSIVACIKDEYKPFDEKAEATAVQKAILSTLDDISGKIRGDGALQEKDYFFIKRVADDCIGKITQAIFTQSPFTREMTESQLRENPIGTRLLDIFSKLGLSLNGEGKVDIHSMLCQLQESVVAKQREYQLAQQSSVGGSAAFFHSGSRSTASSAINPDATILQSPGAGSPPKALRVPRLSITIPGNQ